MSDHETDVLSNEEIMKRFTESCTQLEDCDGYCNQVTIVGEDISYSKVLDEADAIYERILKYAKLIYSNLQEFGFSKRDFKTLLLDLGATKEDIDSTKDFHTDIADKPIYSDIVRVEGITDKRKLVKFLRS